MLFFVYKMYESYNYTLCRVNKKSSGKSLADFTDSIDNAIDNAIDKITYKKNLYNMLTDDDREQMNVIWVRYFDSPISNPMTNNPSNPSTDLETISETTLTAKGHANMNVIRFTPNTVTFIARLSNRIIGYVCCMTINEYTRLLELNGPIGDPANYGIRAINGAYLYNMIVLDKYRNHRIAQKLLDMVDAWANEYQLGYIVLTVHSDNNQATHLYRKYGYVVDNEMPDVSTDKSAYVMIKYINMDPMY